MTGIRREKLIELGQCLGGLPFTMQYEGIVVTRGHERRRKLECAGEQTLRIAVAAQSRCHLGEHADGGDIRRVLFQMGAQQRFRWRDSVLAQIHRGFHQARILYRMTDLLRVGGLRSFDVVQPGQQIAQRAPGFGEGWLQMD